MKFTSLPEEAHFKMIKRLLFSSIVATQFFAFSAIGRVDASRCPDLSSGSPHNALVARAEDPLPCPDCDPPNGPPTPGLVSLAVLRAEDPLPCPDCDAPNVPLTPGSVSLTG